MPAHARRQQLMDAALDIIVRDGYRAVSVEAIARELDVTRPVFYNVFDSLDELLAQLLDRQEKRALEQLTSTLSVPAVGDDLAGYVRRTTRSLAAMVTDDPRTWAPIFLAAQDTPHAVQARVARDRELIRRRFRDFVAAAPGDRRLDPDIVAHSLVAVGLYFGRLLLEDRSSVDPEALATTLSALLGG